MIRTKGEAGTGDVVEAVRHMARSREHQARQTARADLASEATHARAVELVEEVRQTGRLPVVTFIAGGIATPADAAL